MVREIKMYECSDGTRFTCAYRAEKYEFILNLKSWICNDCTDKFGKISGTNDYLTIKNIISTVIDRYDLWMKEYDHSFKSISDAIDVAVRYGGTDGEHHKAWVIDQMVRILAGEEYEQVVADYENGIDGETYSWDIGIAP